MGQAHRKKGRGVVIGPVIYFLQGDDKTRVKIGYTENFTDRLRNIQTGNSELLKVLGFAHGTKVRDTHLKKRFDHLKTRKNGEWFRYEGELKEFIEHDCYTGEVPLETKIAIVEPDQAESWIEKNSYSKQRKIAPRHVAMLAAEMQAGRFRPTAQIGFAILGKKQILVNGQHTLHAIVRSGKSQACNIVYHEVESNDQLATLYWCYDENKKRLFGEIAHVFDVPERLELSISQITQVGSGVAFIEGGFANQSHFIPHIDKVKLVLKFGDAAKTYYKIIRSVKTDMRRKLTRKATMSIALTTLYYGINEYGDKLVNEFWEQTALDNGIHQDDPRKMAYKHILMTGMPSGKSHTSMYTMSAAESVRYIACCWNKWTEGEKMKRGPENIELQGPININGTPFVENDVLKMS